MGMSRVVAVVAAVLTSSCGSAPQAHPPRSVFVGRPPPEPLPEVRSGPPAAGMTWISGYWHYTGPDYVWIPGHWEAARPGYGWTPPAVVFSPDRRAWVYEHGRWEPSSARALH